MTAGAQPTRPGWYADPLRPETQERRWDGSEWTDETREASVRESAPPAPAPPPAPADLVEPDEPEDPETPVEPDAPAPATRGVVALVVAVVVLVCVLLVEMAYLWGPLAEDPTVSGARPVLVSQAAERSAVDTAAQAAVAFTERDFATYDEQVDAAAAMMTDSFAQEFRQTTDDAKDRWVESEIQVTAEVAAQGVMTASEEQVEVLIFLNQFTTKKGEDSVFTPFRLKVTLIDTEQGWLVSDVDAT